LRILSERDIREVSKVPIGHLDLVGADCIEGWAGLRGQQEPVVVEIYLDREKVWECLADHVRRDKAALFQWVQNPPGDRSSRKQPGQAWRRRNV